MSQLAASVIDYSISLLAGIFFLLVGCDIIKMKYKNPKAASKLKRIFKWCGATSVIISSILIVGTIINGPTPVKSNNQQYNIPIAQ